MHYKEKYNLWLNSPIIDRETKQELLDIQGNEKEIEDRFYKDLEFGTAGLRGKIGAGSNRMNKYTVGMATQGLANYICKKGEEAKKKGVVIAYDSRRMSSDFALHAALVLCANGIKTYLYKQMQPTPILSFSIRELGTISGIVITASHNPPEYNGYKVYWSDGAQVSPPMDREIIEEVSRVKGFEDIKKTDEKEALEKGLLLYIDEEVVSRYIEKVTNLCINKSLIEKYGKELKVVYTPLNGTGNKPVRRVLKELGFEHVFVVPEQELPDPDFSTVGYPNPEDKKVFALGIELAEKHDADLIIATDPDCDRIGVVVKNKEGEYVALSGNQIGALIVYYVLSGLEAQGRLPENSYIVKSIVTSELGRVIADSFGVATMNTLTGFKFICGKVREIEERDPGKTYIMGYEESHGYVVDDFVRDKDGVIASMFMCEMAAWYKSKGMTLYEGLIDLWEKYGYYADKVKSIQMEGREGMERIQQLMNNLRDAQLKEVAGIPVVRIEDYYQGEAYNLEDGSTERIDFPVSNVLKFYLKDNSWFSVRPSGTEPKVKFYFSTVGSSLQEAEAKNEKLIKAVDDMI
ncbi:MAG: phospho-sugar mutase [Clostridiales bacterium]|jgi:phosphoglucomutase|nr:phospho-sugar mutase [Clostridiales bacterium]